MAQSIKGTRTEKNLLKAFAGESQAKNRYTFFAKQAKREGFEESHAKIFFRFLEGGPVEITATYPAGVIGSTAECLGMAAEGEHEEWTSLYPGFGDAAQEEGFPKVATAFRLIAKVEEEHEKRFARLLHNLKENKVFEREEKVSWVCRKCGYVHYGRKALNVCPVCDHPMAYFELKGENY
jgi:rubrerythrin